MTKRDVVRLAGAFAIGAAVAAGVALFGVRFGDDTETGVTLTAVNGTCTLGKATLIRVRANNDLIWEIENFCTDGAKTVMVGNFQKGSASTATDCSQPGADYPFTDASAAARTREVRAGEVKGNGSINPSGGKIKLRAQGNSALGTYYFDICMGGAKADPELMVER